MIKEAFFSGYCRQLDSARTVSVEARDKKLEDVDCLYESCPYAPNCPIAQSIDAFLEEE